MEKSTKKTQTAKGNSPDKKSNLEKAAENSDSSSSSPLMVGMSESSASTSTRRNVSSTIERSNRFENIERGMIPFKTAGGYGAKTSNVDVKEAVILCQKAYYNFAVFRNTVDLMTEFSVNNIYFKGGSKKSREFFDAFFKKVNVWDFQDKFFREYYRSGNVFIHRFDGKISRQEVNKITQVLASNTGQLKLPIKYIILNPADIQHGGNSGLTQSAYKKVLNAFEVQKLKNPESEEDIKLLESLPKSTKEQLKGRGTLITVNLDPEKTTAIFYTKQDYEPFAVPMGYPVMEDINWKAELKKMDMAISRTMQQAILLVTMGTDPDKGGINQKNLSAMQTLFENSSVGRVLIADYTTKAEFVIPRIADLLDPKKYEVVDRDILNGLNNVLFGNETFSNQSVKLNVFVARLQQARESFMNEFLIPEMKRISKDLGFKNYPTPHFDEIDLKDDSLWNRIMANLMQLGVLTPNEGVTAIETGRLPDEESSKESQERFKKMRDQGLYMPLVGGSRAGDQGGGRPEGETAPQTTKNVSPVGESTGEKIDTKYSFNRIMELMASAEKLNKKITTLLKRKHKLKTLNENQKGVVDSISELVIVNEAPEDWISKAKDYVNKPVDKNVDRVRQVESIAATHQIDSYLAGIMFASKP